MANPVVNAFLCTCSFGGAPCILPVTSQQTVQVMNMPQGTIMDNKLPTFGMCSNPANPAVAAATAAAMCPRDCGALGPRRTHGAGVRKAPAEQFQQAHVFLRRRDPGHLDPRPDRTDAVILDFIKRKRSMRRRGPWNGKT